MKTLYSERGTPLVISGGYYLTHRTITVELYVKWYSLYIIENGEVRRLEFGELPEADACGECITQYCDHAPNPQAVELYANIHGMLVDSVALEIIAGRWAYEYENRYPELPYSLALSPR